MYYIKNTTQYLTVQGLIEKINKIKYKIKIRYQLFFTFA